MIELKGKAVADEIKSRLKQQTESARQRGIVPKLTIVRVGNRDDDLAYESRVVKNCQEIGIEAAVMEIGEDVTTEELIEVIHKLNQDRTVHGVLVFSPLPKSLDEEAVRQAIEPRKDVDCMNAVNLQKVFLGDEEGYAPCTAEAVIAILKYYGYPMEGKNMVIVNRSMVLGKPLAMLALKENATVTICHSKTEHLYETMQNADIIVTGVGRARQFGAVAFAEKNVVIDVGINFDEQGKMCGDVNYEEAASKVAAITPVPGGVGSVTSAILLSHVLKGLELQWQKK